MRKRWGITDIPSFNYTETITVAIKKAPKVTNYIL